MTRAVAPLSDYPPPGMEVRLIERYVQLSDRLVLEIGCGDGRLTRHLAHLASGVVAIDPDPAKVSLARRMTASEGIRNVSFRVGLAEHLRPRRGTFDVVMFSWSL